jgi:hypothetical protein
MFSMKQRREIISFRSNNIKKSKGYQLSFSLENFTKSCHDGIILIHGTKINTDHLSHFSGGDVILVGLFNNKSKKSMVIKIKLIKYCYITLEESNQLTQKYNWKQPPIECEYKQWNMKLMFQPIHNINDNKY